MNTDFQDTTKHKELTEKIIEIELFWLLTSRGFFSDSSESMRDKMKIICVNLCKSVSY